MLGSTLTNADTIPVLDLEPLIAGRDTGALAVEFARVYGETGFAYVTNHGVNERLVGAVFDAARRFHALPLPDKSKIALDRNHRGYIAINTSTDYPPQPPQAPDDLYGSAPHTDFGCLTLLAQDDVGGLEVMTPDGRWIAAPPMKGAFVVNVGDMLHRMSNGRLRSTPHRVINRTGRERYSVPFFFDPHVSTVIEPLAGTGTPQFPPIHFGDFLRAELEAGYDAHKQATEDGN